MPRRLLTTLTLVAALACGPARPDAVPVVAVDIPPVAGLVAAVMEGAGTPHVLLKGGGSAHAGALRPSEARNLQEADLVVWIGPGLTPWLGHAIDALAPDTPRLTLLDVPATHALAVRESAVFAPHAASDDHEAHHDHGHGHNHGHNHGHDHGHAHGGEAEGHDRAIDPHAWLDPDNAVAWLNPIAEALARADPDRADLYRANAAAAAERIAAAAAEAGTTLAPVGAARFMVGHDAFQYFEAAFGLSAAGAITLSDDAAPGPAHIAALRDMVSASAPVCVFLEPGENDGLFATVFDGKAVRRAVLDPLGWSIPPGPDHYPAMLRNLADTAAECLS